jgi:hypothetical protein
VSRARLRRALSARDHAEAAIVPLLERHAARLEQLSDAQWLSDAEAQSRLHRNAQRLYDLDAVALGADGMLPAIASWIAASPGLAAIKARDAALARTPLAPLPQPASVAEASNLAMVRDAIRRLRPVLAERAGIAIVLPDAPSLAAQLGVPQATDWASDVLVEVIRFLGAEEPDLLLLLGTEPVIDGTIESLAEFFGMALLPIGAAAPAGVVILSAADFCALDASCAVPAGWLYTTESELDPASDPQRVKSVIGLLRERGKKG